MIGNSSSGNPPAQPETLEDGGFFGALARWQSYVNILYLLISFPLGITYFAFIMTGLSVAFGLMIVVVGFLILLLMLVAIRGLASWERQLANLLLGAHIPPPDPNPPVWQHPLIALKRYLTDSYSWKCLGYFLVQFPLAVVSFMAVVFFVSLTLTLLTAPLLYNFVPIHVFNWRIMEAEEALICAVIGLVVGVVGVHVMNGLAALRRALATALLSGSTRHHPNLKSGPVIIS
jgi:hypothetical protein